VPDSYPGPTHRRFPSSFNRGAPEVNGLSYIDDHGRSHTFTPFSASRLMADWCVPERCTITKRTKTRVRITGKAGNFGGSRRSI
ncbi:MAG: hypothetical protein ACUVXJ_12450, partial [Phycisphaerae bacterium]